MNGARLENAGLSTVVQVGDFLPRVVAVRALPCSLCPVALARGKHTRPSGAAEQTEA